MTVPHSQLGPPIAKALPSLMCIKAKTLYKKTNLFVVLMSETWRIFNIVATNCCAAPAAVYTISRLSVRCFHRLCFELLTKP